MQDTHVHVYTTHIHKRTLDAQPGNGGLKAFVACTMYVFMCQHKVHIWVPGKGVMFPPPHGVMDEYCVYVYMWL